MYLILSGNEKEPELLHSPPSVKRRVVKRGVNQLGECILELRKSNHFVIRRTNQPTSPPRSFQELLLGAAKKRQTGPKDVTELYPGPKLFCESHDKLVQFFS